MSLHTSRKFFFFIVIVIVIDVAIAWYWFGHIQLIFLLISISAFVIYRNINHNINSNENNKLNHTTKFAPHSPNQLHLNVYEKQWYERLTYRQSILIFQCDTIRQFILLLYNYLFFVFVCWCNWHRHISLN